MWGCGHRDPAAGMGWMLFLWNAPAHPQGSPDPTKVGAHGCWDAKFPLKSHILLILSASPIPLFFPGPSTAPARGGANWQSNLLGKEQRNGKPIDLGPDIPTQGTDSPEWRDLEVWWWERRAHARLPAWWHRALSLSPTPRAGCHLTSGCLPPSFTVLGPSVC